MKASNTRKAIVLLSGGLDSATTMAIAKKENFEIYAMTFRYGQRHLAEIEASRRVAERQGVAEHMIVDIDLRLFEGSALTSNIEVPKGRAIDDMATGIPVTYVPARNTIFLSFALAWAETLKSEDIFIGVNALDYSGYPDCRQEFITAYQQMANLATREGVEGRSRLTIHTPLIAMTKGQIIRSGLTLGVDYGETSTCYDPSPGGEACGECDACLLRLKGFAENGVRDPAPYLAKKRLHA
jgi:7-cyano-7-deazaguanine synthase